MPELAGEDYSSRIVIAATYLKGIAAEAWGRNKVTFTKWEDYIRLLRGVLSDPETRKSNALLRLTTKAQKDTQTVRDLLAQIKNLEQDIPPMEEEERRAWILLNALRPALRAEVIREHKEITSRDQVLASAQRYEEVSKQQARAESQKGYSKLVPMRPVSTSHDRRLSPSALKPRESSGRVEKRDLPKKQWGIIYYKYNKQGYKADRCTESLANRIQRPGGDTSNTKN